MKKILIVGVLGFSAALIASENNMSNVLNGNGSIGNVTINQTNSITNTQVESQQKIEDALLQAYKESKNGSKSAGQLSLIAGMASEVNKESGTSKQKNDLCKSKAKLGAEVLGYQLNFAFNKCDEFFTVQ